MFKFLNSWFFASFHHSWNMVTICYPICLLNGANRVLQIEAYRYNIWSCVQPTHLFFRSFLDPLLVSKDSIYYIKSSVVALFSVKLVNSVKLISVKLMYHCNSNQNVYPNENTNPEKQLINLYSTYSHKFEIQERTLKVILLKNG